MSTKQNETETPETKSVKPLRITRVTVRTGVRAGAESIRSSPISAWHTKQLGCGTY